MRANANVRGVCGCAAQSSRLFFCEYLLLCPARHAGVRTTQDSFAIERTHAILTFLKRELRLKRGEGRLVTEQNGSPC